MAWLRLSDNYVDHPKFFALSDGAFRLWHESMAYCRRHQTDGLFSFAVMRAFRSFTKSREKQLAESGLWDLVPAMGYRIHDYLDWNPSRDEENERRAVSKAAMRAMRERRQAKGIPPPCAPPVSTNNALTTPKQRSHDVLDMDTDTDRVTGKGSGENPTLEQRAQRLREELYPRWYSTYRHGARLRIPLIANSLEFSDALSLVQTWDDTRLEKLARIVLTTNDEFIAGTDRGFKIFALKAGWADNRLCEIEQRSEANPT